MKRDVLALGNCRFEVLTEGDLFLGLGAIHIGNTQVRSGRLPLRPYTQSFTGVELAALKLGDVATKSDEIRLNLTAIFRPLKVKLLRDHSFDPIHETDDWDVERDAGQGRLTLVLRLASDQFEEFAFNGFSYHYEYESDTVPLFYLLDMATWELDGNIAGATVISQSSCSAPVATFKEDTYWTTEGLIHWDDPASKSNPVMTHNLPRWASHQAFDFQYKNGATLAGVYDRVGLIRTLLQRKPGKAELKTLDKHIFDQALAHRTTAKSILVNTQPKSDTTQRNLWTWMFDVVANRARAEYGLAEEPLVPRLYQNYWDGFTIDTYREDLLPAAVNVGFKALFIDNLNKSAATERCPGPNFHWNMCCGHEYEIAPRLGGPEALKRFMDDCRKAGIRPYAWTNNDQALSSPVNAEERDEKGWFVRVEDTRLKYGGAYSNVFSILDLKKDAPRQYWVNCLKAIKDETGLDGYLFDSFYNLGFMPVNYAKGTPTTQWRELLLAFKDLQDAGISFLIESFGPFGSPQHGCPASYAEPENVFSCYKLTGAFGYTTIPTADPVKLGNEVGRLYRFFAHMASPSFNLFQDGVRIDKAWTAQHKQALADYYDNRPFMHRRFLQEDAQGVLWHDQQRKRATLWNFTERDLTLPGTVQDLTAGKALRQAASYKLEANHTYAIYSGTLPEQIGGEQHERRQQ